MNKIRGLSLTLILFSVALPLLAADEEVVWFRVEMTRNPIRTEPTTVTVSARNRQDERVPSYRGTVHFMGSDASIGLPPDYTFTEADQGRKEFTVTFNRGYHKQFWVIDANGPQGSAEAWVLCPNITVAASIPDQPVCPGQNFTLTATTNATQPSFHWQFRTGGAAGPTFDTQTAVTNQTLIWQVVMTDAATGCFATTDIGPTLEPGPQVDAPASASGDFTATIANDPNGPYRMPEWTVTGGTIVSGQDTDTITIRPKTGATDVQATVSATRISTECRRTSWSETRIVPFSASITGDSHACSHSTRTASVPDAGQYATYTWTVSNGTITSGQGTRSITYDVADSGEVQIGVTVEKDGARLSSALSVDVIESPSATVMGNADICPGDPATISALLEGTAPFTIVWSDGVTQSGITSATATRTVTPSSSTTYAVTGLSDANCSGTASGSANVFVGSDFEITRHPANTTAPRGSRVTLTVASTGGTDLRYHWYEGISGDRSRLAASTLVPSFTTPPLDAIKRYWVEIISDCATAQSRTAVVSITSSKRRASRH